jgi:pimeloyl-ACP methyl ester carboxylesterase
MKNLIYLIPLFFLFSISLSIQSGQISKVNDIDIWWDSFGKESDPPLLMIMGLNANSQHWPKEFIQELVDKDLYVVIYDNRDTGKSTWINNENFFVKLVKISPNFIKKWFVDLIFGSMIDEKGRFNIEGLPSSYDIEDMSSDAINLMRRLGIDKFHILGVSMGGMIAQQTAIDYPDNIISLTSWMSSPGFNVEGLKGPEPFFVEAIKQSALLNFQNKQSESILYIYEKQTGSKYNFNQAEYQKRVNMILSHGENSNSGHMLAVGASENRLNTLPKINIPTLVIHGTEDPLIPFDHGKKTHFLINNSKFIPLEGVGHEFVKDQYGFITTEIYNHIRNAIGEKK